MSDTSTEPGVLEAYITSEYGDDPGTPDHIYMKLLSLARVLDEEPHALYPLLLTAIGELTRGIEQLQLRVLDVHDDLDWLDQHLSVAHPAWYHQGDEE